MSGTGSTTSLTRPGSTTTANGCGWCTLTTRATSSGSADPDQAYRLFHEGQQLAQNLHEPWLVLFFEEWCGTALLHFKRDYRNVLDLVVRSALEARKPQYAQYPGRLGVFDNLIAAYLGIDPAGYAEPVRQAMDYLDGELCRAQ